MNTSTNKKVVTRFAPSPTGYLHIGGIRTALYNYLFAKKHGGTFYVRIEDTDTKRFVADAENYIKESLEWCGIIPDAAPWMENKESPKGPYRQSERDYKEHIEKLLDCGLAYYGFDTPEYIKNATQRHMGEKGHTNFIYGPRNRMEMRNSLTMNVNEVRQMLEGPYVIRFKNPEGRKFEVNDIIRGPLPFDTNLMDDKILFKSNGVPTYHLANTCDDHDMGTTHVIRGEEWIPSLGIHYQIYEGLGWDIPEFAHLPLILNPNGKGKLSKRTGLKLGVPVFPLDAALIEDDGTIIPGKGFKSLGYDPGALLNFLILLGWTPKANSEMMSMDDMIEMFELSDVHLGGAKFDVEKAKYFNQQYIANIIPNDVLLDHVDIDPYYRDQKMIEIIELAKARSTFFTDLQKICDIFTRDVELPIENGNDPVKWFTETAILKDIIDLGLSIHHSDWNKERIKETIDKVSLVHGEKDKFIMPELRKLIGKGIPGPDLLTTMEILGRNESLYRMSIGLYK